MKGLNKSEKILISILLVMLVGYVYYQFVITPVSSKLQTAKSNVDKYEQELLAVKVMEASNKKLAEEMVSLKANYEKNVKLMPKSDMTAQLIRDVNRLAIENKVTLNSLTLGNGAEYKTTVDSANAAATNNSAGNENIPKTETAASSTKVMAIPVSLNITGDYNSFTSYMNILESNTRLTNINTVNVQKGANVGDGQLTVSISASVLYIQDGTNPQNVYEFNNGTYSKENPFK
jgi:Tfp pilus assembly protein PilO